MYFDKTHSKKDIIKIFNSLLVFPDIHQFGGIPSVRRACIMFNKNPHEDRQIQPIIPKDIQDELNEKRKIKRKYIKSMTIKSGEFILSFD
mgnify:CR=1 FL=1